MKELERELRAAQSGSAPPSAEALESARAEGARYAEGCLRGILAQLQARDRRIEGVLREVARSAEQARAAAAEDALSEPIDVRLGSVQRGSPVARAAPALARRA